MAVISIIGAPSVGKSFLVKQLAALTESPAFFEGEEGSIPAEVLENVFNEQDPVKRYSFFVQRLTNNLGHAKKIASLGLDCFVDGASMSPQAIMQGENQEHNKELHKLIEPMHAVDSDIIIVLIASKEYLAAQLKKRARSSGGTVISASRIMSMSPDALSNPNRTASPLPFPGCRYRRHFRLSESVIKFSIAS